MKQHKWHKEIKAWADGAEIEFYDGYNKVWEKATYPAWFETDEYRIKPEFECNTACGHYECMEHQDQCKRLNKPQYLYVYMADEGYYFTRLTPQESKYMEREQVVCIGKIKLEEVK